ncbi:MAG: hypothetical protein ACI3Z7_01390 [Candidatus Aphodosoma sp.]
MNKLMDKLPQITMYTLLVLSLVFTAMFWLGGSSTVEINGEVWNDPAYSGLYLNWAYILCGIAVVLIIVISIWKFVTSFIANPKKGVMTLVVLVVFAAVFVVSWYLGSDAKLEIIGYEGTDNQGVMARYSDMCLYSAYALAAAAILSMIVTSLYSKLK